MVPSRARRSGSTGSPSGRDLGRGRRFGVLLDGLRFFRAIALSSTRSRSLPEGTVTNKKPLGNKVLPRGGFFPTKKPYFQGKTLSVGVIIR